MFSLKNNLQYLQIDPLIGIKGSAMEAPKIRWLSLRMPEITFPSIWILNISQGRMPLNPLHCIHPMAPIKYKSTT